MLDVSCPFCAEVYHVAPTHLGRSLRCRRCERVFEIVRPQMAAGAAPPAAATAPHAASQVSPRVPAAPSRTKPIEVTDSSFAPMVLQSRRPVLVDFWAPWCGPCHALAPTIEQLAQEYAGRITFVTLNTDDNPRTAGEYQVLGLPTLVLFKGGREVSRLVGVQPGAVIKRVLDQAA